MLRRPSTHRTAARSGTTLAELLVVAALIALISGFVFAPFKRGFDRLKTRAAAREAMTAFYTARAAAIARGQRTAVLFDQAHGRVSVTANGDTVMMRPVGSEHGVAVTATRDSMAFFPDGLGVGAANLRVIFTRGAAADTVIASREGRVKLGAQGH